MIDKHYPTFEKFIPRCIFIIQGVLCCDDVEKESMCFSLSAAFPGLDPVWLAGIVKS